MNITVSAWTVFGIALFLCFMMTFVATGSIDELRMRENFSSAKAPPATTVLPSRDTENLGILAEEYPFSENSLRNEGETPQSSSIFEVKYPSPSFVAPTFIPISTTPPPPPPPRRVPVSEYVSLNNKPEWAMPLPTHILTHPSHPLFSVPSESISPAPPTPPTTYSKNPHFKKIQSKKETIPASKGSIIEKIACVDHVSNATAKCSVFNEQAKNSKHITVNNNSPITITVYINKNTIATIPSKKSMLLDRSSRNKVIVDGDIISIRDSDDVPVGASARELFAQEITLGNVIDIGMTQFVYHSLKSDKGTSLQIHNLFNLEFECWYADNYIGLIKPNSNTKVEVHRQGFKEGTSLYFRTLGGHEYHVVIPKHDYREYFELYIGGTTTSRTTPQTTPLTTHVALIKK